MPASATASARMRGTLMGGALLGLLALSIYGFWSRHLLQQSIWQPAGAHRFLIFLTVVCVSTAVLILFRPPWLIPITLALTALYTIAAVGILPPVAAAFFLFSCLVLGRLLLPQPDAALGVVPGLLALLAGLGAFLWLAGILAHFAVNYPATYLAMFAAVLVVKPRTTAACLGNVSRMFAPVHFDSRRDYVMLTVALVPLLAHWLIVLKPEISEDALSMHLVVPAYIANHHLWSFDFRHFVWAVMPMGGVWGYTAVYLVGGEFAARLLNFALLLVICALMYRCALRWVARPTAFLLVGLFAATPVVQLVTGSLFVETFYAVFLVGALAALWEYQAAKERAFLVVSALLLASAMGVKLLALPFVLPALGVLAWELIRIYRAGQRRWLILCAIVMLAIAPEPYLYAWWKTGNPVFPFLNNVFHSPYFSQVLSPDSRFSEPLTWRTPFDLTFETHRYWEGQDGSAGFQFLLLVPLVFLSARRGWRFAEWTLAGIGAAGMLAGLVLRPNVRYLYPAFPILTLSLALIFWDAAPALRRAAWVVCAVCLGMNLWFLPSASWYDKTFCLDPFEKHAAENYLAVNAPARLLVDRLNRQYPGESALFLGTMELAGLRGEAWSDGWHSYRFIERVEALKTDVDVLRLFRELGLRHFIFPSPAGGIPVREAQVRRFLEDFTQPEADRGSLRLSTLKPEFAGVNADLARIEERKPAPAPPGRYDDFDTRIRFLANWSHDPQFEPAANHSLTYSDLPDASFQFRFKGSAVTWVYTKALNRGIAVVSIDGVPRGDVDLYSAATVWQARTDFTMADGGEHTLEIRISGRKNPSSSGTFVDLDELIVQ